MKKLYLLVLLLTISTLSYAGAFSMPDFVKRNTQNNVNGGGNGVDYKYISASTHGWIALATNEVGQAGNYCGQYTGETQSSMVITLGKLARAPQSVSWDVDIATGKCINITSAGPANDNLAIIDVNRAENFHHLDASSFITYVSLTNLNPITTTNYQFGGNAYTRYQVNYDPALTYGAGSTLVDFDCVIDKQDLTEQLLGSLRFNNEKKGVLYHLYSDPTTLVNGIPACQYGRITITLRRLVD